MTKRIHPFVPALERCSVLTVAATLTLTLMACGGGGGGGSVADSTAVDTSNEAPATTTDTSTVVADPATSDPGTGVANGSDSADSTAASSASSTSGGTDKPDGPPPPAGSALLVDGQVGDNPFYHDGTSDGFADGRSPEGVDATPVPVSIRWEAVTQQMDQLPENELAGYRIYYGHVPGNYEYVIEVSDPAAQAFTVADLPSGTYYFAATAVDAWDQEGPFSSVTAVTIN